MKWCFQIQWHPIVFQTLIKFKIIHISGIIKMEYIERYTESFFLALVKLKLYYPIQK